MKQITIYTDGACSGNPGPGGWAAVIINPDGSEDTLSGGFANTTNNRMELMAIIKGLQSITYPAKIVVYSDSEYAVNSIAKGWIWSWIKKGWRTSSGGATKNKDLWEEVLSEMDRLEKLSGGTSDITIRHVPGHSGQRYNEMCDKLAVEASKRENLPVDEGYESEDKTSSKNNTEVYNFSSRLKARLAKEIGEASGRELRLSKSMEEVQPIIDRAVDAFIEELTEIGKIPDPTEPSLEDYGFSEFSVF